MTHDYYHFKIFRDDGQLRPETLSMKDLALLLNHLDKFVRNGDEADISMVEIRQGSVDLISYSPTSYEAHWRDFGNPDLTGPSREARREIDRLLKNLGDAKAEISTRGEVIATITEPLHEEPEFTMTATCSLYGILHAVGGPQKPKVTLKLSDGQTVICHTDKELAVKLAHRLYQEVGVRGEAVRNDQGMIRSFEITSILPYKAKTREEFDTAFLKLAERYGTQFVGCDDSFIQNLRCAE